MTYRQLLIETWHISEDELTELLKTYNTPEYFRRISKSWDSKPRIDNASTIDFYKGELLYSAAVACAGVPFDSEVSADSFGVSEWVADNIIGKYVLNFGSGYGGKCIALGRMGHHVTFYDIDAPHTEVLKRSLDIIAIENLRFNSHPFRYKFDSIVTDQVMEHLFSPLSTVQKFYDALFDGGRLLMDYFFGDGNRLIAEHLPENNIFGDDEYWNRCVESIGFIRIDDRVWQKPGQLPKPSTK